MNTELTVQSPFSGTSSDRIWGWKDGKPIYRCPDTGAAFFDRRFVDSHDYQEYYPYLDDFDAERFRWELSIRENKYRKQLQIIRNYTQGSTLLDVGAGPGYFCRVAENEGWDAIGIELSECAVKHGKARFSTHYTDLSEIDQNSLDAIVCHHILEHIQQPMDFIGALSDKLKTGGLLVVHVPHEQPLTFKIRSYIDKVMNNTERPELFCSMYGDEHISGFTRESLKSFIERCGYRTHFVRSAGMWSKYYDPFFFKNYLRNQNWAGLSRSVLRHAAESIGTPLGLGDWVIGYFGKQ